MHHLLTYLTTLACTRTKDFLKVISRLNLIQTTAIVGLEGLTVFDLISDLLLLLGLLFGFSWKAWV